MLSINDCCRILKIEPNATNDEIKTAFKIKIIQNHPDKVAHMSLEIRELSNQLTCKIIEAYNCLIELRSNEDYCSKYKILNSIGMTFILIQKGEYIMGANIKEGYYENEKQHKVIISCEHYMQTTPVTNDQWHAIMGGKYEGDGASPKVRVPWDDAIAFIHKLNQNEETDKYRLPTEAEWEYSCRAGCSHSYCFGDDESALSDYAWTEINSKGKMHNVALKKPNAWGLYDMHGNVAEWCSDWYDEYNVDNKNDPKGPALGEEKVVRGGYYEADANECRSAYRFNIPKHFRTKYVGFRILKEA